MEENININIKSNKNNKKETSKKDNNKAIYIIVAILVIAIPAIIIISNLKAKKGIEDIFSVIGNKSVYELGYYSSYPNRSDIFKLMTDYKHKPYFKEYSRQKFDSYLNDGEYLKAIIVLEQTDIYDVRDNEMYEKINLIIKDGKYSNLSDRDLASFIAAYARLSYKSKNYNAKIEEYIKEKYPLVITEDGKGGYYDSQKDKYKDSSRNVNPLGTSWSTGVGTYVESTNYYFYGDILVEYYYKHWYGTSSYDSNNSSVYSYEFKDKRIKGEFSTIGVNKVKLFDLLKDANGYDINNYLIVFKNNRINVVELNSGRLLAYEGEYYGE